MPRRSSLSKVVPAIILGTACALSAAVSPALAELVPIDSPSTRYANGLVGVACPASRQCTAGEDARTAITFDPQAPGHTRRQNIGTEIAGLACPTVTQCTAIGAESETTFNPR